MGEYQGYEDPRTEQGDPIEPQGDNLTGQPGESGQPGDGQNLPPESPQPQDTFDPQGFVLNYRGKEVYPTDKQHLINLAQQGYSYSQSMEKLNARQKELDELGTRYDHYNELDTALRENPALAQKMQQVYQEHISGGGAPPPDDEYQDPHIANLSKQFQTTQQELQELKQWREEQANRQADSDLNKTIEELKGKYPDQPWDQDSGEGTLQERIIKHALDNDITNLRLAYKDYMWDSLQANTQAETLRKQKEKVQKDFNNGIVNTGNTGSPGGQREINYNPKDDYGDITQKAIRILGG